jgi:IclR family transcriptional regulator, acetate operon repressor
MREQLTFAARGPVKSAQRVLEILDYFASTRAPATLSALSSALELPKSSCLALIATLHASGYLYEVKPGVGYYPTRRWLDRATGITASDPLATKMRPIMLALSEETGETIILGKRAGDRVIYIEVVESSQTLRYAAVAGQFKPLHGTASGKALLAGMAPTERDALFHRYKFIRLTSRTISSRAALERDIQRGTDRGWHISRGENEPNTTALAVPIIIAGEVLVLVVAGMTARLSPNVNRIGAKLRAAVCGLAHGESRL